MDLFGLMSLMITGGMFVALIIAIVAGLRWLQRKTRRRFPKYRLEQAGGGVALAELDSAASTADREPPVEVWRDLYWHDPTVGVRYVYSHVFVEFDHGVEMVIRPKRFPGRGFLNRVTALARPLGFTSELTLGVPEIDDRLHIHVPRTDRSARGRLRTQELRRLLERVSAEPDLLALYLLPRNVRRREHVFGRAFVRAVSFRPGILVLFDCDLDDLDLERIGSIASAAQLCRGVLS